MWAWLDRFRLPISEAKSRESEKGARAPSYLLEALEPRLLLSADFIVAELARVAGDDPQAADADHVVAIFQLLDQATQDAMAPTDDGRAPNADGPRPLILWPDDVQQVGDESSAEPAPTARADANDRGLLRASAPGAAPASGQARVATASPLPAAALAPGEETLRTSEEARAPPARGPPGADNTLASRQFTAIDGFEGAVVPVILSPQDPPATVVGDHLLVDGAAVSPDLQTPLTEGELDPIFAAAKAIWLANVPDQASASALDAITIAIGDLMDRALGESLDNSITVDTTAAGYGWFVDPTPMEGLEFSITPPDGIDLLTVVLHEIGHVLGYEHGAAGFGALMAETLGEGERFLPPVALPENSTLDEVIDAILGTFDPMAPPAGTPVFTSAAPQLPAAVTIGTTEFGGVDLRLEGVTLTFSDLVFELPASRWDGEVQIEASLAVLLPGRLDIVIVDDDFGSPAIVESVSGPVAGAGDSFSVTFVLYGNQTDIESGDTIAVFNSNEAGFDDADLTDARTITVNASSYSDATDRTSLVVTYDFDPGSVAWTGGSVVAIADADVTDDADAHAAFGTIQLHQDAIDPDTGLPEPVSSIRLESLDAADLGWPSWLDIEITDLQLEFPDFRADHADSVLKLDAEFQGFDTGDPVTNELIKAVLDVEGAARNVVFDIDELARAIRDASGRVQILNTPIADVDGISGAITGNIKGLGKLGAGFILKQVRLDAAGVPTDNANLTARTVIYAAVTGLIEFGGKRPEGPANADGTPPSKVGGFKFLVRFAISELGPLSFYLSLDTAILVDAASGLTIDELRGGIRFNATVEDLQVRPPFTASAGAAVASGDLEKPVAITLTVPGHTLQPGDEFRITAAGDADLESGAENFIVTQVAGDDISYLTGGTPGDYSFFGTIEVKKVSISDPRDLRDDGFRSSADLSLLDWEAQLDQQVVNQAAAGGSLWDRLFDEVVIEAGAVLSFKPRIPDYKIRFDVDLLLDSQLKLLLSGTLVLGSVVKFPVRVFADLSDLDNGAASMLFLADLPEVPDDAVGLKPLLVASGDVTFETLINGVPATLDAITGFPSGIGTPVTGATFTDLSTSGGGGPWQVTLDLIGASAQFAVGDTIAVVGSGPDVFNGTHRVSGVTADTVSFVLGTAVVGGGVDINRDGIADASDSGSLGAIPVIQGRLDVDRNGIVDAADDGEVFNVVIDDAGRRAVPYTVIDGYVDVDGDGSVNPDSADAVVIGADPRLWPDAFDLTWDIVDGGVDVDADGDIDADDAGSLAAIRVFAGLLDIDGDGVIDAGDDGTLLNVVIDADGNRRITSYDVIDGHIDIDGDGNVGGDAGDDLSLAVGVDRGGYWLAPGFAAANEDDLGQGLRISLNGGVDLNLPEVTTLSLKGSGTLDLVFDGAQDARIEFTFDMALSETNFGNIALASGRFTITFGGADAPVVAGITFPGIWGAASLTRDFNFLNSVGLYADASMLLIINNTALDKPAIILATTDGAVSVVPTANTFALRLDGQVDFRIDGGSVFQAEGAFVLEFSEQGFNALVFNDLNGFVEPATLRIGPEGESFLDFKVFGFLAIRLDGFAANLLLELEASLPEPLDSLIKLSGRFVFIVNTTRKDVSFQIPGGLADPNRPSGLFVTISRAPPASPETVARSSLQSLINGNAWSVSAATPGSAYGLLFFEGSLELLSVITLEASGYVLVSPDVVLLKVEVEGDFLSLVTVSGSAFFSSEGEFEVIVNGGIFLGTDGFNIDGSANLRASLLDANGVDPFGTGDRVLNVSGNLSVGGEIFYLPLPRLSVGISYNSTSGDIMVSVGSVPVPFIDYSCFDTFFGEVCVPYPNIELKDYMFSVGTLRLTGAEIPLTLGQVDAGGVLTLNVGNIERRTARNLVIDEENEFVFIDRVRSGSITGEKIRVTMFGVSQTFDNVTSILVSDMDSGNDYLEISDRVGVDVEVHFGAGQDVLFAGGSGVVTAYGDGGDDRLRGGSGNDLLFGGADQDVIEGGGGADVLQGGTGDDILIGGVGVDTVNGGDGNDTIVWDVFDGNDLIDGEANTDTLVIRGSQAAEQITITPGATGFAANIGVETLNALGVEVADIGGGGGADGFTVSDLPASTLQFILLSLGTDGDRDTVTVNGTAGSDTFDVFAEVVQRQVAGSGGVVATVQDDVQRVAKSGSNIALVIYDVSPDSGGDTLSVDAGAGVDTFNARSTIAGLTTTLAGGSSSDVFNVGTPTRALTDIRGLLNVDGSDLGSDTVNVIAATNDGTTPGVLTHTGITGLGMTGGIGYQGVEVLNVDFGAADDVLTVQGTAAVAVTTVNGNGGADRFDVTGIPSALVLNGGAGNDQITAGDGNHVINGGDGADVIVAGNGDHLIRGERGADTITVGSGNSDIAGGGGADTITVAGGSNLIHGDDNPFDLPLPDTGAAGGDTITVAAGVNEIHGQGGDDIINAGSGDDDIFGEDGADVIDGGAGHDYIVGGAGDDILRGGAGDDILIGGFAFATRATFEAATRVNYSLLPAGETRHRIIPDFLGDASHDGSPGDGADRLFGDDDHDLLFGGGDVDQLSGGAGADYLDAGLGDESVVNGDAGDDVVRGGDGNDLLHGGTGIDLLIGDAGSDRLYGDAGDEAGEQAGQRLFGGAGDDFLHAYAGNAGNETSQVGDALFGGAGGDFLYGNLRKDTLDGGSGKDVLIGDANAGPGYAPNPNPATVGGNDLLLGGSGEDQLFGGGGDDTLWGGADTDLLDGQGGSDTQHGGSGVDFFTLYTAPDGENDVDVLRGHTGNAPGDATPDDNATDILVITGTSMDDEILLAGDVNPNRLRIYYGDGANDLEFTANWRSGETFYIEQVQIAGLGGNDTIGFITADMPVNPIPGALPLDLRTLAAGRSDFTARLDGNGGDDTLFGAAGRDRLDGGPGDDTLYGFGGDDQLWGDLGDGSPGDHDVLYAGQGNDDLIGGVGSNDLYAWSRDPDPGQDVKEDGPSADFGVFITADGELVDVSRFVDLDGDIIPANEDLNGDGIIFIAANGDVFDDDGDADGDGFLDGDGTTPAHRALARPVFEPTGLNRIIGGAANDNLFGGTVVDFMFGNGGNDALFRADGTRFESLDGGLAGDEWKEYARESDAVWYVGGTNAADEIRVDFVTEPGLLADHHLITRLTENNGFFSFAADVRLDLSATDANGDPVWNPQQVDYDFAALRNAADDMARGEALASSVEQASTDLVARLLPPEGDFLVILIDALGGNDTILIGPTVQKTVWIDAGAGDDRVEIRGGNSILVDRTEQGEPAGGLRGRNDIPGQAFDLGAIGAEGASFTGLTIDNPADVDYYAFRLAAAPNAGDAIRVQGISTADRLTLSLLRTGARAAVAAINPVDTGTGLVALLQSRIDAALTAPSVGLGAGDIVVELADRFPGSGLDNAIVLRAVRAGLGVANGDAFAAALELARDPADPERLQTPFAFELSLTFAGALAAQAIASSDSGVLELDANQRQLAAGAPLLLAVESNRRPTVYQLGFDPAAGAIDPAPVTDFGSSPDSVRRDVILGGPGDDVLLGGFGEDFIFGQEGNDVLSGGADRQAADLLFGGPGDDTFQIIPDALPVQGGAPGGETFIPTFSDQFVGGEGNDRVLFLGGDLDRLGVAVPDFAALRYNTGLHRYEFSALVWDIGAQAFRTTSEGDGVTAYEQHFAFYQTREVESTAIDLRAGDDVFHADAGFRFLPLLRTGGILAVDASANPSLIEEWGIVPGDLEQGARIAALTILGGDGNDRLFGGAYDDSIDGGAGADVIAGGPGNDRILGQGGADTLYGNRPTVPVATLPYSGSVLPDKGFQETHRFALAAPFQSVDFDARDGVNAGTGTGVEAIDEAFGLVGSKLDGETRGLRHLGDLNRDGFDDFLLSADDASYLLLGPVDLDGLRNVTEAAVKIFDHASLGQPAARFGDLSGDGLVEIAFMRLDGPDLVITAVVSQELFPLGQAVDAVFSDAAVVSQFSYLFRITDAVGTVTWTPSEEYGLYLIDAIGDARLEFLVTVEDDLTIGRPQGRLFPTSALLSTPIGTEVVRSPNHFSVILGGHDAFSLEWSVPGDLDGDGRDEVFWVLDDGVARLRVGASGSTLVVIDASSASPGAVPVVLGDVDGDGFDDFGLATDSGLFVYRGRADLTSLVGAGPDLVLVGPDLSYGTATVVSGDFDGDGTLDIAVSGAEVVDPVHGTGNVYLFRGLAGTGPVNGTLMNLASMAAPHGAHTATLLDDGRVLIVGGNDVGGGNAAQRTEVYDPASGTWSLLAPLNVGRSQHAATLLSDGRVLVTGGWDNDFQPLASVEVYDPQTDVWTLVENSLPDGGLFQHSSTLLPDGRVMLAGGITGTFATVNRAIVYDPGNHARGLLAPMTTPRQGHTASVLPDGRVLVVGGQEDPSNPAQAAFEVYTFGAQTAGTWVPVTGSDGLWRGTEHTTVLLPDGRVLVIGGAAPGFVPTERGAIYTLAGNQVVHETYIVNGLLPEALYELAAVTLHDGRVLVTGGNSDGGTSQSALVLQTLASADLVITGADDSAVIGGRNVMDAALDLDGDGVDDLVVGVGLVTAQDAADIGVAGGGAVYVLYGSPGSGVLDPVAIADQIVDLANVSIPGAGSFVADRGTGLPETFFDDAGAFLLPVGGEGWFRFTTLGDGSKGDFIRLNTPGGPAGVLVADLFDADFGLLLEGVGAVDLRNYESGTYILRVRERPASYPPVEVVEPGATTLPAGASTTRSTLSVSDAGTLVDLDVSLSLTHTLGSAMTVVLESPAGTRVTLFQVAAGIGTSFVDTVLDDEAPLGVTGATAPATGTFRPEGVLGEFDGEAFAGDWVLEVTESVADGAGFIGEWSLLARLGQSTAYTVSIKAPVAGARTETLYFPDRDVIRGGEGADVLHGNHDLDALFGEGGEDRFIGQAIETRDFVAFLDDGRDGGPAAEHVNNRPRTGGVDSVLIDRDPVVQLQSEMARALAAAVGFPVTFTGSGESIVHGEFRESVLASISVLDLSGRSLETITLDLGLPLEPFLSRLQVLHLDGNRLYNLAPVNGLGDLRVLTVNDNDGVFDTAAVDWASLVNLEILELDLGTGGVTGVSVNGSDNGTNLVVAEDVPVTITLDVGASYTVLDPDGVPFAQGNGSVVSFTPTRGGVYTVQHTAPFSASSFQPVPVTDFTTSTSAIGVVGDGGVITDLDVSLDITHTFVGDLTVALVGPDGTRVTLVARRGGSSDDFSAVTFNDAAAASIASTPAPFTGQYVPENLLSAFNGRTPYGNWTLEVVDGAGGDAGTLNNWSLDFTLDGLPPIPVIVQNTVPVISDAALAPLPTGPIPEGTPVPLGDVVQAIVNGNTGDTAIVLTLVDGSGAAVDLTDSSLGFQGGSQVIVADNDRLDIREGVAVEAWVKLDVLPGNGDLATILSRVGTASIPVADLDTPRQFHAASVLPDGRVLILGGASADTAGTAAIYDVTTDTWSPAQDIGGTTGIGSSASVLADGRVLIAGGFDNATASYLTDARLYDPVSGTFSVTGSLNTGRYLHASTTLADGRVLVTGGSGPFGTTFTSAEIYDPATGNWILVPNLLPAARFNHDSALLPDGRVLVIGGSVAGGSFTDVGIYSPSSGSFHNVASLAFGRQDHTATTLPDGRVLVLGRDVSGGNSAEIYDPGTNTWSVVEGLEVNRVRHAAALLPDGRVLVTGGSPTAAASSAEIYDTTNDRFRLELLVDAQGQVVFRAGTLEVTAGSGTALTPGQWAHLAATFDRNSGEATVLVNGVVAGAGALQPTDVTGWSAVEGASTPRNDHTTTRLADGKVLVAGGHAGDLVSTSTAQVFDPVTGRWTTVGEMSVARQGHVAVLLDDGRVLVAGGHAGDFTSLSSAEVFDPATGQWTVVDPMTSAREGHAAVRLDSGKVLVVGGADADALVQASAEVFDPVTGQWSAVDSLAVERIRHTATLLGDGRVLVTGGHDGNADTLHSAEVYDPEDGALGNWSATGTLATGRFSHTATLLDDGTVLVAGGVDAGINPVASAERFDPAANAGAGGWTPAGDLGLARESHAAVRLADGRVLVSGGIATQGNLLYQAAIYDPVTGNWSNVDTRGARAGHTATLLNDGSVLLVGGSDVRVERSGTHVPSTSRAPLVIGAAADGTANLDGVIGEVRLWDVSRSAQAIAADGARILAVPEDGLVGYWRFNEAIGGFARDSASGNDGVLTGPHGVPGNLPSWVADSPPAYGAAAIPGKTSNLLPFPSGDENVLRLTIRLTDAEGDSAERTVRVVVVNVDPAAVITRTVGDQSFALDPGSPQLVDAGTPVVLDALLSADPGVGDALSYQWQVRGPGLGAVPAFTQNFAVAAGVREGTFRLAESIRDPASVVVTVDGQRHASVAVDKIANTVTVSGIDAAGASQITISFAAVPTGARFSFTPPFAGEYQVELRVDDGDGGIATVLRTFHVSPVVAIAAPDGQPHQEGEAITVTLDEAASTGLAPANAAAGFAGTGRDFVWTVRHLDGEFATGTGESITFVPPGQGHYAVEVVVTDHAGAVSASDAATLVIPVTNAAPTFEAGDPVVIHLPEGGEATMDAGASDPGVNDVLDYTWTVDGTGLTLVPSPDGGSATVSGPQQGAFTVQVIVDDGEGGSFAVAGSLLTTRTAHTATLLEDGRVLAIGGLGSSSGALGSVEVYDPASGAWSVAGSLLVARSSHTATLLDDGRVLVIGGRGVGGAMASTEVFDPATGISVALDDLADVREGHTATLLADGRVLVAGGYGFNSIPSPSVELLTFDPLDGSASWMSPGSLSTPRADHTATRLDDGRVLFTGGINADFVTLSSAEIFAVDPQTGIGSLAPTGDLTTGRGLHTATLLADGRVVIVGGYGPGNITSQSAEIYDPGTGTSSSLGAGVPLAARAGHTAILLADGRVLISGGYSAADGVKNSAEIFTIDPLDGSSSWSPAGAMMFAWLGHTATLLADGRVLLTGGRAGGFSAVAFTEIFDPGTAVRTFEVVIDNVAPTLIPPGPAITGTEGQPLSFTLAATDPGVEDTLTFQWRVRGPDGEALPGATGNDAAVGFTPALSGEYLLDVTLGDDDGGASTSTVAVSVANVAPTVVITPAPPASVDEGAVFEFSGTVTDPAGPEERLRVEVDFGDGSIVLADVDPVDGAFTVRHIYADSGAYTVAVTAADESDTGSESFALTVDNLAPSATLVPGEPLPVGELATLTLRARDPGADDSHTFLWTVIDPSGAPALGATGKAGPVVRFIPAVSGTYSLEVVVSDDEGAASDLQTLRFEVDPSPLPIALDDAYEVVQDQVLAVDAASGVLANDVDADTPAVDLTATLVAGSGPDHGTVVLNADGSFSYTPVADFTGMDTFTYRLSDGVNTTTASVQIDVRPSGLLVSAFTATDTGFAIDFNTAVDVSVLNLYDVEAGTLGAADVTVVGDSVGPIAGSLVFDAANTGARFVATGGALAADTYTVRLRSAEDGFRIAAGALLNGDADATPGGEYVTTFSVTPGGDARTVGLPDVARGPGQSLDVPVTGTGLPLVIDDAAGLESVDLTVIYDPALLTVLGLLRGADLPADAAIQINTATPGRAVIGIALPTPMGAGSAELVRLVAIVAQNAPYAAKQVLDIEELSLNEGAIAARDDDAVHLVAYLGDTTANGDLSSLDGQRILRVAVGLDAGFIGYPLADPLIVGDVTGNGTLSAFDASLLLQEATGIDRVEVPALPALAQPLVLGGLDPMVTIADDLDALRGGVLAVPVRVDTIPAGLDAAQVRIVYDPAVLELVGISRGAVTADFSVFHVTASPAGVLTLDASNAALVEAVDGGTLVELYFRVRADAAAGPSALDLQDVRLNDGHYTLLPLPLPGPDASDGAVQVASVSVADDVDPLAELALLAPQLVILDAASGGSWTLPRVSVPRAATDDE